MKNSSICPWYSAFPLSSKTNIFKFQFYQESGTVVEEPLCRCATSKSLFIIYLSAVALSYGRQIAFNVSEKVYMCFTLLPAILRNKSQFHVTVCIKCKCFTSHNVKYHTNSCTLVIQYDINLIRFVFCFSQGDDHSLKEGKVCLQVLNAHKLRICLPNSSF